MIAQPSGRRLEWRGAESGEQHILSIDENDAVVRTWAADPELLRDLLNDMVGFDLTASDMTGDNMNEDMAKSPQDYGPLILARSADGDVLAIDPERYWGGVADWFRSRGDDPHMHRPRATGTNQGAGE